MTKIRVFCAAFAIMLVLAACAISDAFTLVTQSSASPFEHGAQAELDQIQAIVNDAGLPHGEMLQQVDNFVAQVDQLLDDGVANELELLDARDRAIQIRERIKSLMARKADDKADENAVQLVQSPQFGGADGGGSSPGTGGSDGSQSSGTGGNGGTGGSSAGGGGGAGGGGVGGGGGAGGGLGGAAGSLGGLAAAAGATVSATNNKPGPTSSNSQ